MKDQNRDVRTLLVDKFMNNVTYKIASSFEDYCSSGSWSAYHLRKLLSPSYDDLIFGNDMAIRPIRAVLEML